MKLFERKKEEQQEPQVQMLDGILKVDRDEDGVCKIALSGKIDASDFETIQTTAFEYASMPETSKIVFDMDQVTYVSSAGLRMFSAVNRKTAELEKEYKLVNLREDMLKFFQLTGYSSAFCIELKEII